MIEQLSTSVKFLFFFTAEGLGKTGLTVTVDVYSPSGSLLVSNGSASAIGGGLYAYTLSGASTGAPGEYVAIAKTADDTVDQQHLPALWTIGRAGVENLDAAISSRLAASAYVEPEPGISAADVWTHGERTLTESAGGGATPEDVWSYASRTLTQSAAQVAAAMSGSTLVIRRGDTWSATITGLGSLAGRDRLWFTVKHGRINPDSEAVIQIEETDGLLVLNGAPAESGGSLVVEDEATGNVTITIAAAVTAQLRALSGLVYDIQMASGEVVTTLTEGEAAAVADVTRVVG